MYADSTYYKDTFKGTTIPDSDLDSFLEQASDQIDQLTYFRITQKGGLGSLSLFQQNQVKKAVCSQADHLYGYKDMLEGIQSFNNGGNSVSLKGYTIVSRIALSYLSASGLRYRGLQ